MITNVATLYLDTAVRFIKIKSVSMMLGAAVLSCIIKAFNVSLKSVRVIVHQMISLSRWVVVVEVTSPPTGGLWAYKHKRLS